MNAKLTTVSDLSGPFGTPDGSRADTETVLHEFISLESRPGFGALATRADDAKVRVIVGKMGAGKTVYMRRLSHYQKSSSISYADDPQQSLPQTELILRVSEWFRHQNVVERWMQLWGRAILRSLATHLLAGRRGQQEVARSLPEELRRELQEDYRHLLGEFRRPRSIYSALREIINEANSQHHLVGYLERPDWDDLEGALAEALRVSTPVFFYLDAVDDTFNSAPLHWMRCHEGLFLQVMQLLRDAKLGARLHVVICIRDLVLSSVLRSEHAPRYHNEPHIRVLNWTREATEYLFLRKLERLPEQYKMAPQLGDPVEAWLGARWVHNERRGVTEDLLDYVIRHTRLIPRDIVAVGNDLSTSVLQYKQLGHSEIPPEALRRVVSVAAKRFGDSQLAQCASQIAADLLPQHAASHGYSDAFTANPEYAASVRDKLKSLLGTVGVDRFRSIDLVQLEDLGSQEFGSSTNVASVLWQNGLLGYVQEEGTRFYSLADVGDIHLPRSAQEFVFHPCVLDAVPGLRSSGSKPVRPFVHD